MRGDVHLQRIAFVLIFMFVFPISDSDLHSCLFFVHFTIFIKILDLYSFYNFENFILSLELTAWHDA
jgi:hypothetical protein